MSCLTISRGLRPRSRLPSKNARNEAAAGAVREGLAASRVASVTPLFSSTTSLEISIFHSGGGRSLRHRIEDRCTCGAIIGALAEEICTLPGMPGELAVEG